MSAVTVEILLSDFNALRWFIDDTVTRKLRVILRSAGHLASELLKGLALSLRDEEGSEDTAEHEECEDLHDVGEPRCGVVRRCAAGIKSPKGDLRDNGANFAASCRDAVRG